MNVDLLGFPLAPDGMPPMRCGHAARRGVPNGHAAKPGLGPVGETCKTCVNICHTGNRGKFKKCGLMREVWTHGKGTDIRAKSPACQLWGKRPAD